MAQKLEKVKKEVKNDYVFRYNIPMGKANIRELLNAIHVSLCHTATDNTNQKNLKTEWRKILQPIIDELEKLYKMLPELDKNGEDYKLLNWVLFGGWNWNDQRMSLGVAISSKKIFRIVSTLVKCIRRARHDISVGGPTGKSWDFQRELTGMFNDIVKLVGKYTKEEREFTNKKTGEKFKKTIKRESITEIMHAVVMKFLPPSEEMKSEKK